MQRADHGDRHVIERLGPPGAKIEDAGFLGVVEEPQIHGNHVIDKDEVAHLLADGVTTVLAKQLDLAFSAELVELVERHTGHAALVLLTRAVHVEVAKPRHLLPGALEVRTAGLAHHLVEQQLAVAVDVQWLLVFRRFHEVGGAAVDSGRRSVQQARAALLAGFEQPA